MNWQTIASYRNDPKSVKGKKIDKAQVARIWLFAKNYRKSIVFYISVLVISAIVGAIPPLLFKELLDKGIGTGSNPGSLRIVVYISIIGVVVAIVSAGLALFLRYYSAKIGEGLIYDLRVALFDHIQKQPLSFFTRTQTGSLMTRYRSQQCNHVGSYINGYVTTGMAFNNYHNRNIATVYLSGSKRWTKTSSCNKRINESKFFHEYNHC